MVQPDPEPAPAANPAEAAADQPQPEVETPNADTNKTDNESAEPAVEKTEGDSVERADGEVGKAEGEVEKTEAEKAAEAEETARRTVIRFLWSCAWLTVLVTVFLISGLLQSDDAFDALAWLGVVLVFLCLFALIAAYVGCALSRITLRTRLLGPVDVFQASTVVVAIAVICGLLIPTSNKAAIALLFPWALTYWMYGLDQKKKETPAS